MRAITNSRGLFDNAVMISSTMPSLKYSCSGSPLMLLNGSTAIDGRFGKLSAASDGAGGIAAAAPGATLAGQSAAFHSTR
ncbi:MAG TPA: hypothetical protein VJ890_00260, partial [Vineibacter sp.]|nr:hypothetical protein [Vineibacter sp.]